MSRLLITANSPGEMAGWVKPFLKAWTEVPDPWPVDLLLLPCTFSTGEELRVARELRHIANVYRPRDYLGLLLRDGHAYRPGALLHLGGDLMYSALLGWRWNLACWSYLWTRPWWNRQFQGFFTKDQSGVSWLLKRRAEAKRIHCVGDLVLDAVRNQTSEPRQERQARISYLPGSRSWEVAGLSPLFLETHSFLNQRMGPHQGFLHVSPFIAESGLQTLLESPPDPKVGGIQGRYRNGRLEALDGSATLEVITQGGLEALGQARLAVSIPGTKTAEAGYLRTPVLTIVPLNRPERLPTIGLLGLLDLLPGGSVLKGHLLLRARDKVGFLAQPNIRARKFLMPEIVDLLSSERLYQEMASVLQDNRKIQEAQTELERVFSWDFQPAAKMVQTIRAYSQTTTSIDLER